MHINSRLNGRSWGRFAFGMGIIYLLIGVGLWAEPGPNSEDGIWETLDQMPIARGAVVRVQPKIYTAFRLNPSLLDATLSRAPEEGVAARGHPLVLSVPMPNGDYAQFELVRSPVMQAGLAAKFPSIQTYVGEDRQNPAATIRADRTPAGFHAQVISPKGSYYVDPYFKDDPSLYVSYYVKDYAPADKEFRCWVEGVPERARERFEKTASKQSGATRRTYLLAMAAQGEYTEYHGGTVAGTLAAIVTTVNRVTGIYERDLAVRLMLVNDNDTIIFTDKNTDPYSANESSPTILSENQSVCDSYIGSVNYHVGHVVNTGGGGLAGLAVICDNSRKAKGATGSSVPEGDPFDVDYVAHELGHQFGGNHTFNGASGNCSGGNRNAGTAYEPGSGSTIMAYAGICGIDDLQAHSDPFFHSESLNEMLNHVETEATCSTDDPTGNTLPTVSAGSDYTIPIQTPFVLTASGNDADGDPLTYSWEERDLGPQVALSALDDGQIPLTRVYSPSTNSTRMIPNQTDLLNAVVSDQEKLPSLARTMNFQVVARDGKGGIGWDDVQLTVANAGPLKVTAPNSGEVWSGSQTVTWNVNNTDVSPVNATYVDIRLSVDGGWSFPILLATHTPNDGNEDVSFPNLFTSQARVQIQATSNLFFDISEANFSLQPFGPYFVVAAKPRTKDTSGNGNGSGCIDPGEVDVRLDIAIQNRGQSAATGIFATLSSLTSTATITGRSSTYPDLSAAAIGTNQTSYIFSLDADHTTANPVHLRLLVTSDQATNETDFILFPSQFFSEPLDANPGWTTQGAWVFGQPTGGGGEYGNPDPTSGYSGTNVYGYNLSGDYAANLSEQTLTTPAIDCSAYTNVHLFFQRWLGVEESNYDHAYLRASTNEVNWVTVWQNTSTLSGGVWEPMEYNLSSVADGQQTVYLRWVMGSTDSSWQYCGWNLDDIQLRGTATISPIRSFEPAWWSERGVLNTNHFPSDFVAGNAGQLKWIATQAAQEFEAKLPGGAGSNITMLVNSLLNSNNYLSINQGQLKNAAKPFYDRLWELGLTNAYPAGVIYQYPWTTNAPGDYNVANIGQLKYLFSFELE